MLKQNDFQAPHASASAEEHVTEQLVAHRSGGNPVASHNHKSTSKRGFGKAARLGVTSAAALALIGGFVTPAHAETTNSTPVSVTSDSPTSSDPAAPGSTEATTSTPTTPGTSTGALDPAAEAAQAKAAQLAAAQAAAAKRAAAVKAAAAKKKAIAKKKAAKKRALLKKRKAAVNKKRRTIVRAAERQLGNYQDCTAVVEKALRKAGKHPGDLGTQVSEYTHLGGRKVSAKHKRAGDILIWPGRHVAVYAGKGKAVHGGWGGTTVENRNLSVYGTPIVVRYFKVKKP